MERSVDFSVGRCGGGDSTPACSCRAGSDRTVPGTSSMDCDGYQTACGDRSDLRRGDASVDGRDHPSSLSYRDNHPGRGMRRLADPDGQKKNRAFHEKDRHAQNKDRTVFFGQSGVFSEHSGFRGEQPSVSSGDPSFHGGQSGVFSGDHGSSDGNRGVRGKDHGNSSEDSGSCDGNHGFSRGNHGVFADRSGVFSGHPSLFSGQSGVFSGHSSLLSDQSGLLHEHQGVFSGAADGREKNHAVFFGRRAAAQSAAASEVDRTRLHAHPLRTRRVLRPWANAVSSLLSRRRGAPSGSSHAKCPKPGFRSTVFK
jgi:hypothetical protein